MHLQKVQRNSMKENSNNFLDYQNHQNDGNGGRNRRDRTINPSIFISKTFEILENQQFSDIIRWNPDGLTFIIDDVERFEKEILPVYFRHRNFSSFVRQLNMYDFHKIRNQANSNIFEHKEFKKHCQYNLKNIKRKGCQGKKSSNNQESGDENRDPEPFSSKKLVSRSKATVENSQSYIPKSMLGCTSLYNIPNTNTKNFSPKNSPSTSKKQLIEDFISTLPQKIDGNGEMEELVREMKNNPKYICLNSKQDLKRIVRKIRKDKMKKQERPDDLEELSIQEEIIVDNIDGAILNNPSLAVVSTQKFINMKSMSIINSLHFCEDVDNLLYQI